MKKKTTSRPPKNAPHESLCQQAGSMAHDVNNLLTGIFGYIHLAKETCNNSVSGAHLENAIRLLARTRDITNQLLAIAHKGSGKQPDQTVTSTPPLLSTPPAKLTTTGNLRILIMDDEEFVLDITGTMLHQMGHEVVKALHGEDAIELTRQALKEGRPFQIAILDLTIRGGMGGKETLTELLSIAPEIRCIASRGYSNDPVMSDHEAFGFCGVLRKPYLENDLTNALQLALRSIS